MLKWCIIDGINSYQQYIFLCLILSLFNEPLKLVGAPCADPADWPLIKLNYVHFSKIIQFANACCYVTDLLELTWSSKAPLSLNFNQSFLLFNSIQNSQLFGFSFWKNLFLFLVKQLFENIS